MRWIPLAVVALLFLVPGSMAVHGAPEVHQTHVTLSASPVEAPDAEGGVYRTTLTIEAANSGGLCACTRTTVTLFVQEASPVKDVRFQPRTFTIDWTDRPTGGEDPVRTVPVTFRLSEEVRSRPLYTFRVTIDGEAWSDSPVNQAQVLPTQVTVTTHDDESTSGDTASTAGTDDGLRRAGPGLGGVGAVGFALLALGGVGWRLRRDA